MINPRFITAVVILSLVRWKVEITSQIWQILFPPYQKLMRYTVQQLFIHIAEDLRAIYLEIAKKVCQ